MAEEAGLELVVVCGNHMGDIFRRNAFNLGLDDLFVVGGLAPGGRRLGLGAVLGRGFGGAVGSLAIDPATLYAGSVGVGLDEGVEGGGAGGRAGLELAGHTLQVVAGVEDQHHGPRCQQLLAQLALGGVGVLAIHLAAS